MNGMTPAVVECRKRGGTGVFGDSWMNGHLTGMSVPIRVLCLSQQTVMSKAPKVSASFNIPKAQPWVQK